MSGFIKFGIGLIAIGVGVIGGKFVDDKTQILSKLITNKLTPTPQADESVEVVGSDDYRSDDLDTIDFEEVIEEDSND